jgi:hypothetical protein
MNSVGAAWQAAAMVSRITVTAVDANDPELVAAFWRAVLGWHERERDDTVISIGPADGPLTGLDVARVSESKVVKNRLHFDLRADGSATGAELERLLGLGARPVEVGQGSDVSWVVLADPDPKRKLEHYAAWHRDLFSTGRDLFATGRDVLAAALNAGDDPAVAELHTAGYHNSQAWAAPLIADIAATGSLAPGLTQQEAIDRAWILTSVEIYFRATDGRGWTNDHYQQWLADLLSQQLLNEPNPPAAV